MHRMVIAAAALSVALAGCGSSSSSSSSTSSSSAASSSSQPAAPAASGGLIQATMKGYAFNPKTIHAKVGQSIHWVNDDSAPHNVTGTGGPSFKASPTFSRGGSFTLRLTQAGTIQYFCTIHPFMKATIVVSR